jgi:hypothetical protein
MLDSTTDVIVFDSVLAVEDKDSVKIDSDCRDKFIETSSILTCDQRSSTQMADSRDTNHQFVFNMSYVAIVRSYLPALITELARFRNCH